MSKRAGLILLISLLTGLCAHAQVTTAATVSKDKIYIGERFTLKLELKAIDRNATVHWKFPDSIPHFEYVQFDTANQFKRSVTLTSFDSGLWAIDDIVVSVPSNINDGEQVLRFPAKEILIEYDTTGNQLLNDVKPIIETTAGEAWIGYAVAAAAVLSLILLIVLFWRWKTRRIVVTGSDSTNTALEDFLLVTTKLKLENWDTQLIQKKNFSELDYAVKRFYERKLRQPFTRLTTDELALELKPHLLNDHHIRIIQALRLGDAVKFAKFSTAPEECIDHVLQLEAIIQKSAIEMNPDA